MAFTEQTLLVVEGLEKRFGGIQALADYALRIRKGELVGLIGPNGAGKTTVFNILSGVLAPTRGSIRLEQRELSGRDAARTARAGIARTFQNIRLFQDMTVLDNIRTGFHHLLGHGLLATVLQLPGHRRAEREITRRSTALALGPKLLLLDEPAAGMNPQETRSLVKTIKKIHKEFHLSILLVEHDMHLVMNLCERIQVLHHGRLLAEGTPAEIQGNPDVTEAYLGSGSRRREARP